MTDGEVCYVCGAPATKLCDGKSTLEELRVANRGQPLTPELIAQLWELLGCDRPMCDAHAHVQGRTFWDGAPDVTRVDTTDLCADCLARKEGQRRPPALVVTEKREAHE